MKKEVGGKKGKWLWLAIGIVALLAVVGVVLALVFGGGQGGKAGGRPELYWNVDREANINPDTGLSTREPAEDGNYYVRFAHDGEQIELPVADKKLVNHIDGQSVMGLELDRDGAVIDVYNVDDVASVIGESVYIQNVSGDTIIANSSITMNGKKITIKLNEELDVYDVTGKGEFVGQSIKASDLKEMDTIAIYGTFVEEDSDEETVATHIFATSRPVESPVYWRADQFYDSTNKVTTREPDENDVYTIPFFCDGETVELKCKNKALVNEIDAYTYYWCHFGFEFDEEGYIIGLVDSFLGSRTMLQCQRYDITEYLDGSYTATDLIQNNGAFVQGTIDPDCPIYDVSKAALAEGQVNRKVDSLQVGDRVCIWTDFTGKPVLVYIANRMVDCPVYFNVTRQYNAALLSSTRVIGDSGYYEVTLLKAGDTQNQIYYIKDKAALDRLDSTQDRCVGMTVGEGNIVEYVYDMECVFGNSSFCRGWYVVGATGSVCSFMVGSGTGYTKTGVLAEDFHAWNVSTAGKYGEEVTLQYGDYVLAGKTPTGEVSHAYVLRRYLGEDTMYWNLNRMWDATNKVSTREPDENGWYVFNLSYKGKEVTAKTKDFNLVNDIDISSVPALSIVIKNGIIQDVNDGAYATGGTKYAAYTVTEINGDEFVIKNTAGAEKTMKLKENTVFYNVSRTFEGYLGEKTNLRVGDFVNCFTDFNGHASIIYVRGREVNKMAWPANRQYDSANATTARIPDANGWYHIELAIDGEVKTYKTKNKTIATTIDSYTSLFGVQINGDVIVSFAPYNYVKNVNTLGVSNQTVSAVKGNKITAVYTLGSEDKTGTSETITLPSNCKIYDVSPTAAKFGAPVKLQVGDTITSVTNDDGEHIYVYVTSHCTRKGGFYSYCDHCKKAVYWNAFTSGSTVNKYDTHYYLPADVKIPAQFGVYTNDRDFEMVLDLNGHTAYRTNGRAALVRYGDTFTVMDSVGGGVLRSVDSTTNGGTIMVTGGTVNLYGGTLEAVNSSSAQGGIIYASDADINIYGGLIKDGVAQATETYAGRGGNVYVGSKATLNMVGGTISGGTALNGVYTDSNGASKTKYAMGGNIYAHLNAVVNISGGTIEGGISPTSGGNIYSSYNAVLNIGGNAVIKDGQANSDGGNILLAPEGNYYPTLNLNGGTITGGVASKGDGSNIFIRDNCIVNIAGGTVSGDFCLGSNVTLGISGAPKIAYGTKSGLKIADGTLATLGAMSNGAEIYVNAAGIFTKPSNNASNYQSYFKATDSVLEIAVENNALKVHCPTGYYALCEHCNETVVWVPWNGTSAESFHYFMEDNITLTETVSVGLGANVILDLKGHTVTPADGKEGFKIKGTLSVVDTVGNGAISGGSVAKRGANIYVDAGTFNLFSGKIMNGTAGERGGNVYVTNGGVVNIKGGVVSGGSDAKWGANVYALYSTVNISGGEIIGNNAGTAPNVGAMGYNGRKAYVNISGGKITGNEVNLSVKSDLAEVTISGGVLEGKTNLDKLIKLEISGNPDVKNLVLGDDQLITLGELQNTAKIVVNKEGAITAALTNAESYLPYFDTYASDKTVVVDGGALTVVDACVCGCKKPASGITWVDLNAYIEGIQGGEIAQGHYYLSANMDLTQELKIGTDTADVEVVLDLRGYVLSAANSRAVSIRSGSELAVIDSSTEKNGVITAAGSDKTNGGVIYNDGSLILRSGTITRTAGSAATVVNGGVVYMDKESAVFDMYDGTIAGGYTDGYVDVTAKLANGGNLYVNNGTFNMYGGTISNGVANAFTNVNEYEGKGGNIFAGYGATVNLYGGTVTDGTANKGSAIYLDTSSENGADLTVSDAEVVGNVYVVDNKASVTVSGAAKITDLSLNGGALVNVGLLSGDAKIKINATSGVFTAEVENAETARNYFGAVSDGYMIAVTSDKKLEVVSGDSVDIESDPDYCPHCNNIVTWTEITTIGSTTDTGHYRLTQDYTAVGVRGIGAAADVVIDLAGYDITANANTRLFAVYGGLSILDSSTEKTGELIASDITAKTGNNGYGACVYLSKTGDYGTFNLYGGTIRGGRALRGGNIYVANGEVNIHSGTVKDGYASQMGGNICLYTGNSRLNVYGGTITQTGAQTSAKNFGNITNYDGVVNVYGGEISDTRTGGKSIHSSGTTSKFNVYGGTLTSSIGWHGVVGVKIYNGVISGQDPTAFKADCATVATEGTQYVVTQTTLDAAGKCDACQHTYSATTNCGTCDTNHVPAA